MTVSSQDAALREALQACLARALPGAGPPRDVRSLAGGWSNAVFATRVDARDLIVRLARIDEPEPLGVDRVREAGVLAQVARAGLSPAPLHVDTARGELVLPDVGADALSERQLDDSLIAALGSALRVMHALPCPPLPPFDPLAYARLHLARAARFGVPPPPAVEALLAQTHAPKAGAVTFTHNDLNPDNLLVNERIWIVDWELAAPGDPVLDLVTLAETCGMTGQQELLLFEASGRTPPSPPDRDRYGRCHAARQYAWALARRATGYASDEVVEQELRSAQQLGIVS